MGIDDLRVVQRHMGRNISAYATPEVMKSLKIRFGYLFSGILHPESLYRPILDPHEINGPISIGEFKNIIPIDQDHGICNSLGFRFGNFAYSTDVVVLPEVSLNALKGIDTWIVDSLHDGKPHPTHANLKRTLEWIDFVKPRRTILTHMTVSYTHLRAHET